MKHEKYEQDFIERFLQQKTPEEMLGLFLSRYTVAGIVAIMTLILLNL